MDLIARGRGAQWNNFAWRHLLELAEQYGWIPMGTGPPLGRRRSEWNRNVRMAAYCSNDGARLYARDAAGLAAALERALPDISTTPLAKRRKSETTLDFFAGWGRKEIRSFIRFCRKGSFRIY